MLRIFSILCDQLRSSVLVVDVFADFFFLSSFFWGGFHIFRCWQ